MRTAAGGPPPLKGGREAAHLPRVGQGPGMAAAEPVGGDADGVGLPLAEYRRRPVDGLRIDAARDQVGEHPAATVAVAETALGEVLGEAGVIDPAAGLEAVDRKSTRLNSSH